MLSSGSIEQIRTGVLAAVSDRRDLLRIIGEFFDQVAEAQLRPSTVTFRTGPVR